MRSASVTLGIGIGRRYFLHSEFFHLPAVLLDRIIICRRLRPLLHTKKSATGRLPNPATRSSRENGGRFFRIPSSTRCRSRSTFPTRISKPPLLSINNPEPCCANTELTTIRRLLRRLPLAARDTRTTVPPIARP